MNEIIVKEIPRVGRDFFINSKRILVSCWYVSDTCTRVRGRTLATMGRYTRLACGWGFPRGGSVLYFEGGGSQTGCHFHPPHIIPQRARDFCDSEPTRYYVPEILLRKTNGPVNIHHRQEKKNVNTNESSCLELKKKKKDTRYDIIVYTKNTLPTPNPIHICEKFSSVSKIKKK